MIAVGRTGHGPFVRSVRTWLDADVLQLPVFLLAVDYHSHAETAPDVDVLNGKMAVVHHVDAVLAVVVVVEPVQFAFPELLSVRDVVRGRHPGIVGGIVRTARLLDARPYPYAVRCEPHALGAPISFRKPEMPRRARCEPFPATVHHLHLLHRHGVWIVRMPVKVSKLEIGIRGIRGFLINVDSRADAEAGERIAFPVPIHLEVADLDALAVLHEKVRIVVDEFALWLASEFRRTLKLENGSAPVEREVSHVRDDDSGGRIVALVRTGGEFERAGTESAARLDRTVYRRSVEPVGDGKTVVSRLHDRRLAAARLLHRKLRTSSRRMHHACR